MSLKYDAIAPRIITISPITMMITPRITPPRFMPEVSNV